VWNDQDFCNFAIATSIENIMVTHKY